MKNSLIPTAVCSLVVAGLAFACFGSSEDPAELVDSAIIELNSGDPGQAATALDRALQSMEADHPDFARAQSSLAAALAHFEPDLAGERFLAFAEAHPQLAPPDLFRTTAEAVFRAGRDAQVVGASILHAGIEAHPDARAELEEVVQTMMARGNDNSELFAHLASMGYVSGSN